MEKLKILNHFTIRKLPKKVKLSFGSKSNSKIYFIIVTRPGSRPVSAISRCSTALVPFFVVYPVWYSDSMTSDKPMIWFVFGVDKSVFQSKTESHDVKKKSHDTCSDFEVEYSIGLIIVNTISRFFSFSTIRFDSIIKLYDS